jgi:hypothetical protein
MALNNLISLPGRLAGAVRLSWILCSKYGYLKSAARNSAIDPSGVPLPWYTYPAIEFIAQLDFANKSVFEYGSGNSTLFWSRVSTRVTSVEHNPEWFEVVSARAPANCRILLEPDLDGYVDAIDGFPDGFDVIVVDGYAQKRTRARCAQKAIEHLKPGGMIILDNADWLPASSMILRQAGLIEVDMAGFGPINRYTWTTSFFLSRDFDFDPATQRRPGFSKGAMHYNWEPVLEQELLAARAGSENLRVS